MIQTRILLLLNMVFSAFSMIQMNNQYFPVFCIYQWRIWYGIFNSSINERRIINRLFRVSKRYAGRCDNKLFHIIFIHSNKGKIYRFKPFRRKLFFGIQYTRISSQRCACIDDLVVFQFFPIVYGIINDTSQIIRENSH